MRSLLKAGLVAGFAVILFVGHVSSAAAQQTNKADELNKRVMELRTPFPSRSRYWPFGKRRSVAITPMSQRRGTMRSNTGRIVGKSGENVGEDLRSKFCERVDGGGFRARVALGSTGTVAP
jgi:hypothetical protein